MKTSMGVYTILLLCSSLSSFLILSIATDTITMSQSLRDGETVVSAGGSFELGFFSPDSVKRYLGIWYKKISTGTVVWVANRETPLADTSGILKVTKQGILLHLNGTESIIWSSNSSRSVQNPVAKLLDSGNFVLRDGNDDKPENLLWQSFDYPGDTILPGMKLGINMITGLEWYLSSWKSTDNPSPGDFTYRLDPYGYPQLMIKKGSAVQFISGPWNSLTFTTYGFRNRSPNPIYRFNFVSNQKEMYYTSEPFNSSLVTRVVLNQNGIIQRFNWIDRTQAWNLYRTAPIDDCDSYAICGAYGSCNSVDYPECECLKGFVPKNVADGSNKCVRKMQLDCQNGDGFIKYSSVKLPDTRSSWFKESMTLEECKLVCLNNCSCMAYTSLDISKGGSGCLIWFGDLLDIRVSTENGQDIYIRMASSELGKKGHLLNDYTTEDQELPLFDLTTVAKATNNFSINNKLGQGGFGPVYKAWRLYIESRPLEIIDASLRDSSSLLEVLRVIHVGLLCVQRFPEDRPSMSSVILMLGSKGALPQPKQPGFFNEMNIVEADSSSCKHKPCSANGVTITVLEAR
ncbi:hypothetical protein L1049_000215 [Liquidambar formosana]|uniref:Uncharacterized protein n=1 Tax=Liquidambar formosana TaxID=63359 RepID=A0AAP0NBY2_LIQFO